MRFRAQTREEAVAEEIAELNADLAEAKRWRRWFAVIPLRGESYWLWLEWVEVAYPDAWISNGRPGSRLSGKELHYGRRRWRLPETVTPESC